MKKISEIINKIIDRFAALPGFQRAWLEKNWDSIVGTSASHHSRIGKIENNTLFVYVDSSVWNQTLFMQKKQYLAKIHDRFNNKIILDIKYQMANTEMKTNTADNHQIVDFRDVINQFIDTSQARNEREKRITWDQLILYRLRNKSSSEK